MSALRAQATSAAAPCDTVINLKVFSSAPTTAMQIKHQNPVANSPSQPSLHPITAHNHEPPVLERGSWIARAAS